MSSSNVQKSHHPHATRLVVDNLATLSDLDDRFHITMNMDKLQTGQQRTEMFIKLTRALFHELQLCGYVAVSADDHMAHALDTDAPWNKIEFKTREDGSIAGMRLKSVLDDYEGSEEEKLAQQKHDLNATLGMLNAFSMTMGPLSLALVEASTQFDKATGAQHNHSRVGDV